MPIAVISIPRLDCVSRDNKQLHFTTDLAVNGEEEERLD